MKTTTHIIAALIVAAITFAASAAEAPPKSPAKPEHKAHYQRPYEPAGKTAFLRLPAGVVRPEGWIQDWAQAVCAGVLGQPETLTPPVSAQVFGKGWTGVDLPGSKGAGPKGSNWPLEQCATWLDGAVQLGLILHDEALTEKIMQRLLFIAGNLEKADDSAYLFMWWTKNAYPWSPEGTPDRPVGFDTISNGWLGLAMLHAYEGTGDARILRAIEKAYCRLNPRETFFQAMVEAYALSGSECLWNMARKRLEVTDKAAQSQLKALESQTGNLRGWDKRHHAASSTIYPYGQLTTTPWLEHRDAVVKNFEMIFRTDEQYYMLPNGGLQGDEDMRGIGAYKGNESCSNARLMTASALLWNTGKGYYGDRMEKGFFNFFPSCLQRDGKGYTYFSRVNNHAEPNRAGQNYVPLCPTLCCPGQMGKSMAAFLRNMWMATWDNGLAWTAYGPCSVRAKVGDGGGVMVNLKSTTAYPFEETIELSVDPEKPATFPLLFRVPEWCGSFSIKVNGTPVDAKADDKGFVTVRREWKAGDKVTLGLPMAPAVHVARELEGAPFAAVHYGPLAMSLPLEMGDMKIDPKAEWKFAIDALEGAEKGWKVERSPMPAKWDWPLAAPLALKVTATRAEWVPIVRKAHDVAEELKRRDNVVTHTNNDVTCLPAQPFPDGETIEIRMVPYGCAKYHMTMFPITARTAPCIVVANPDPSLASPLFVKESEITNQPKENQ